MTGLYVFPLLGAASLLVAILLLGWRGAGHAWIRQPRWLLVGALGCMLLVQISNLLEWAGVTDRLDPLEDFAELLVPVLWAFFLYAYISGEQMRRYRQARDALAETRSLLQASVEQSTAGILIADAPDVKIRMANPAAFTIRGEAPAPLVGIDLQQHVERWQTFHPDGTPYQPEDLPLSRAILKGETTTNEPVIIRRVDGEDRWVLASATPIRDAEGRIVAGVVVFPDVTESKQTEQALRESENSLRSIFRAAPIGIGVVADRMLLQVNDECCRILGYTRDELSGQSARMLYPDQEEYERVGREKYEQIHQKGTGTVETRWVRKDGTIIDVLLSSTPIDADDLGKGVTFTALDITERKRAERELFESEEKLRNIIDHSVDMYYTHGTDHVLTYLSPQVEQILGYTPEEAKVRWQDLTVDNAMKAEGERLTRLAIETGRRQKPYELLLRHKSGREVWVEIREAPRVEDGRTVSIIGAVRDITATRRAEQGLRESEAKFRMLSEQSILAVGILQDGRFKYANQAWSRITEYSNDETLGWEPDEYLKIVHPDDYAFVKRQADKKQAGAEAYVVHYQWRLITASGQVRWVEIYSKAIDYQGRPADFITMIDITQRKQTEGRLRMTQFAVQNVSDAVIWLDSRGRFADVNEQACRNVGYTRAEMLGLSVWDIDPNFPRSAWQEHWNELCEKGSIILESVHRTKDGRRFPVEVNANHIAFEGKEYNVAFVRDITERKRTEELERRQRELVEAELAKVEGQLVRQTRLATIGQVAASIAHELRNPLGAVRNAAFFLKRRTDSQSPKWADYLQMIDREVNTADRIISNLLEMSRAKEPHRQTVRVATLVYRAFERACEEAPVKLDLQCKPEDLCVLADPDQMLQVLGNLMTNAIQAMESEGVIHVQAERDAERARLILRDEGPGIAPDDREKIFEPLFTTKAKGTGLGLAICRQIIERHNGRLELLTSSSDEPGAAFAITMPLSSAPDDTEARSP